MLGFNSVGSEPVGGDQAVAVPPPEGGDTNNYIHCTLAARGGQLHLNLATVDWALFAHLSPADFAAPIAKGTKAMTPGSAQLVIPVPAATAPKGWYMLALADADRTTTVLCPVQVS